MDTGRGGGRDVKNWEIRTDVYTLPCVNQTASRPSRSRAAPELSSGPLCDPDGRDGGARTGSPGEGCMVACS